VVFIVARSKSGMPVSGQRIIRLGTRLVNRADVDAPALTP
jgi:hypothetical protein